MDTTTMCTLGRSSLGTFLVVFYNVDRPDNICDILNVDVLKWFRDYSSNR